MICFAYKIQFTSEDLKLWLLFLTFLLLPLNLFSYRRRFHVTWLSLFSSKHWKGFYFNWNDLELSTLNSRIMQYTQQASY